MSHKFFDSFIIFRDTTYNFNIYLIRQYITSQ